MIPGEKVNVGGTEYTVPPFNLRVLRQHEEALNHKPEGNPSIVNEMERMVPPLLENLQRNYPELTREALEDGLDVVNYGELVRASYGRAGFVKSGGDAGADPSPKAPAEIPSPSTGATS